MLRNSFESEFLLKFRIALLKLRNLFEREFLNSLLKLRIKELVVKVKKLG